MATEPTPAPPPIPLAVVEWLEAIWPDRFHDLVGTDALPFYYRQAGRHDVIRLLRQHVDRQIAQGQSGRQPTRTQSPF